MAAALLQSSKPSAQMSLVGYLNQKHTGKGTLRNQVQPGTPLTLYKATIYNQGLFFEIIIMFLTSLLS